MSRLNKERQTILQPKRMEYAKQKLTELGIWIAYESETELRFGWKGETVYLFPYSGYHAGKSITAGRGIENLLKQLTNLTTK